MVACIGQTVLAGRMVALRDLWLHQELGVRNLTELSVRDLAADGGHAMFLATPQ